MTQRVRRLVISPEFLIRMTSYDLRVVMNSMPSDAKVIQTITDPLTGLVHLFIESQEFDEVEVGAIPPEHWAPIITQDA